MIPFQIGGIALFVVFGVFSARRLVARTHPRWLSVAGLVVAVLGALTVYDPDLTTRLARRLGIGRGADLLLYLLVLAFIASWFLFYHRLRLLQGAVTQLVRELALRDAPAAVSAPTAPAPRAADAGSPPAEHDLPPDASRESKRFD